MIYQMKVRTTERIKKILSNRPIHINNKSYIKKEDTYTL